MLLWRENSPEVQKALNGMIKHKKNITNDTLINKLWQTKHKALIYISKKNKQPWKNGATSFHKQTINFLLKTSLASGVEKK